MEQIEMIPLERIRRNEGQPRQHFDEDELGQLAASIKASGQLQPIVVRPVNGCFEIVAGERRVRALRMLGEESAKCIVRELSDEEAFMLSLLENLQRADLNPVEEARAYGRAVEMGFGMDEVARRVGVPRFRVAWRMEMLRADPMVLHLVEHDQMNPTVARYVARLSLARQQVALRRLVENKLTNGEAVALLEAMFAEDSQTEMFPELKLTEGEQKVARQAQDALQAACRAVQALQARLEDNPDLVGRVLATQMIGMEDKLGWLVRGLITVRRMMVKRRMAAPVDEPSAWPIMVGVPAGHQDGVD